MHQIKTKLENNALQKGDYYIYKEKFGMTAIVRVLKDLSFEDWQGYLFCVKRVIHSPWQVSIGKTFEAGYNTHLATEPAWQLEPYISLLPAGKADLNLAKDNMPYLSSSQLS